MARKGKGGAKVWRGRVAFLADRTIVLFMGVGVGAAIALAFVGGGKIRLDRGVQAVAAPVSTQASPQPPRRPQPVPPTAIPARMASRVAAGQPITIGVFGDSFGDGVWAALYRRLGSDAVKVLRLSQEGTGLTRYQVVNVERQAAEHVKAEPVDVAVIVTGANDTESTYDDAHEHAYPFMTPRWKAVYGARIDRLVGLLRDQGAVVYWVGLPKMREARYDQDIVALDDVFASRMAALGVTYLSTRELSVDKDGAFNLYLDDGDAKGPRLMRANDGIHMTMVGYERLAGPLMARIRADIARAQPKVAPGPTRAAAGAAAGAHS